MLQEIEKRLGGMTSYRVRVAESAGMALSRLLPSTNPWGPGDCGRQDCNICSQQDEKQQDCRKRNILYENRCQMCMVKVNEGRDGVNKDGRGVYVGETSRSMYERSKEHQRDKELRSEDSHQIKHWAMDHPELQSPPKFKFKIISTFGDPLTRQIAESVRIERSGLEILNSRSEYSRCRIPRLRIDMEGWKEANLQGKKKVNIVEVKDSTEETLEKDMEGLEDVSRRLESKRKTVDEGQQRKSWKVGENQNMMERMRGPARWNFQKVG
jgi:hypothetical protein